MRRLFLLAVSLCLLSPPVMAGEAEWDAAFDAGANAYGKGDYVTAEAEFQKAATEARALANGQPDSRVAQTLNNLGLVLYSQRKADAAEAAYKEALDIRLKLADQTPLGPLAPLRNLGALYREQRKYADAQKCYEQAVAISEKAGNQAELATSLNELGLLFAKERKHTLAAPLIEKAVQITEQVSGATSTGLATVLANLAEVRAVLGKLNIAEGLYKRALDIRRSANDDQTVASLENRLAGVYREQGKFEDAEPLLKDSLALVERAKPRNIGNEIAAMNSLAVLYREEGRTDEAIAIYKRAIELRKTSNSKPEDLAREMNELATAMREKEQYAEALKLYQESLVILETTFGKGSAESATTVSQIAETYREMGDLGQAETSLKTEVQSLEAGTTDGAQLGSSLTDLALIYREQDRFDEAIDAFKKAQAALEKSSGRDSEEVGNVLNNLGKVYAAAGKLPEAQAAFAEALRIRQATLDPADLSIATTLRSYAQVLKKLNQSDQAAKLEAQATNIESKASNEE